MGRRLDSGPTPMPRRRAAPRGYWTDLSEAQWAVIAPLVPDDAILYALPDGCSWRLLPADFPPSDLQRWRREGVWARIHHLMLMADRERAGREPSPTAAIIDSQSVRTADQRGVRAAMTPPRRSPVARGQTAAERL